MEAALLSGSIKVMLPKLFSLVEKKYKLHKGVKSDIKFLEKELGMIVRAIDAQLINQREEDHGGATVLLFSVEELRQLAHGIEDCIDSFTYHAIWKQQASYIGRGVRSLMALPTSDRFAHKVRRVKQMVTEAHERRQRYVVTGGQTPSAAQVVDESSSSDSDPRIIDANLVGVDEPRAKLLEQLAEGQPKQLKVISIVGFCGLGKTALAAEVYNRETGGKSFEKHAWVCAALKGPREVLADMLRKLGSDGPSCKGSVLDTTNVGQLCVDVREQLAEKRYFIVIDDIRTKDQWKTISSAFPADGDVSSRVVVTTTIQSVAKACSSSNGYVHKMTRLDEKYSKQLFSKKACPEKYSHYEQPDPTAVLKKCDGQPLALVTIGEFLKSNDWPKGPTCEEVCNDIRYYLENEETFERMRRVLRRNYANLPGHALKACLLYFGMFPSDHPIRRKSLLRRWLAEGFVETEPSYGSLDLAAKSFAKLMDRNIIEPIDVCNNDNVKTCQTYGMMREFVLHMSISQNFVTLFCDGKIKPKYARRLSLHHNTSRGGDSFKNIDLSLVRSLTISGKACETVLDFSKYELLRVLDLEKCNDLKDDHLKDICNLLLLKYLSLGGSVTRLPRDIAKLEHLEALDARRMKVNILPVEVFQLPCLIHLFGKFKFPDKVKPKSEVLEILTKGRSNLETLAGFVTDGSEGFLQLMGHMNKLRKVNIWCESSAGSTQWSNLKEAIQQFIQDEKEANTGTRSLSLHFNKGSEDFLNSFRGPCFLSSLKLHGNLPALPQFVALLRGLTELCLSSTKLTAGVLDVLTNLKYLKYLKLIAHDFEKFIIKDKAFPRLVRLCLELQCPTFPTIEQGALPHLSTLQLLCKDIDGLSDIKIECLRLLEEVTLHPRVTQKTKQEWENATKAHPNRPKVLLLKSVDTAETERAEYYTAPEGPVQETDVQMLLDRAAQSSSNDQLNSSFNDMGLSEVPPALTGLSSGPVPACVSLDH